MQKQQSVQYKVGKWMLAIMAIFLFAANVNAAEPLPPDEAFSVSAAPTGPESVITSWKVAPGYHLYADKLKIVIKPKTPMKMMLPDGEYITDKVRGKVKVYNGNFIIPIELKTNLHHYEVRVSYQGCSSDGFCYPPTTQSFNIHYVGDVFHASNMQGGSVPDMTTPTSEGEQSNSVVTHQGISALVTDQYGVQTLLSQENRGVLLAIFLMLGVLLAFTPCVLPMLPILTSIIAGQKQNSSEKKLFLLSATYVLGMATTYALAGVVVAMLGSSLQVWLQTPVVIVLSSLIFVLLAFSLFEFYELPISRRWHTWVSQWSRKHEGGTFVGVFFMGVLSTLVVSPCVTAPLVGVLLYIGRTGDLLLGASALFVMGLGMGIPLLALGMSAGRWLPKSGKWMHAVTKSFGVIMLGMAIWLLSRIMPFTVELVLWGLYFFGVAMFFSLYLTKIIGRKKINHTLGFSAAIVGVLMILSTVGTPAIVNRWTNDLGTAAITQPMDFAVVHSRSELMQKISHAKDQGQPVLVDFYADWCTSCIAMDNEVFAHTKVQSALQPFTLIRVDLTENNAEDQALLKKYNIVAPPTILFFNVAGKEVETKRIVGELDARSFLQRINVFMAKSCDTKATC